MNESQKYNIKKRKQIKKNQIILFYLYKVQKQAKLIYLLDCGFSERAGSKQKGT